MVKRLLTTLLLCFVFLSAAPHAHASEAFDINADVSYEVLPSGLTHVTHEVSIKNNTTERHAKSFTLNLESITPINIKAYEGETEIPFNARESINGMQLVLNFPKAVAGLDQTREFTIEFDEQSFATRTGEVWEIAIPRFRDDGTFDSYEITFKVPETLGERAYISPNPLTQETEEGMYVYTFVKEEVEKSGISAGFGEFQVFSFSLSYHLENPLGKASKVEIALPPDNAIQRVHYEDISPAPKRISIDIDGNWMAEYELDARERIDVTAKGTVEIISTPRAYLSVTPDALEANLQETEFWPVSDPEIKALAAELKTPEKIYEYVVSTLSYDYARVRPNVERFGAKKALQFPHQAICTEFTDVFITLARAAGIPAREVNGYAYTENPEIEPISLVADVLHAWPEYWNETTKTWVPVDPTWGSTTQGVDYFNKLDLRHFAFVMHGASDTMPFPPGSYKLGPNPQKDVFVSFGQLPTDRTNKLRIEAKRRSTIPFLPGRLHVTVTNPGPRAEYNFTPKVGYGTTTLSQKFIEVMPPYSTYEFDVGIPYSFLGTTTPETLTVIANSIELTVPTHKNLHLVMNLIATSVLLLGLVLLILFKSGRFPFGRR